MLAIKLKYCHNYLYTPDGCVTTRPQERHASAHLRQAVPLLQQHHPFGLGEIGTGKMVKIYTGRGRSTVG